MNGIAFCGIEAAFQVSRLISRACGFGLARLDLAGVEDQHVAVRVRDVGALAVGAQRHPVRRTLPCQIACGCFGSVTSTAVIALIAVPVA